MSPEETLNFFACTIKSGESWSIQCAQAMNDAHMGLASLRAELAREKAAREQDRLKAAEAVINLECLVAASRAFASNFVRQVEEFETWDQDDWPAAMSGLRGFAETARALIAGQEKGGGHG